MFTTTKMAAKYGVGPSAVARRASRDERVVEERGRAVEQEPAEAERRQREDAEPHAARTSEPGRPSRSRASFRFISQTK